MFYTANVIYYAGWLRRKYEKCGVFSDNGKELLLRQTIHLLLQQPRFSGKETDYASVSTRKNFFSPNSTAQSSTREIARIAQAFCTKPPIQYPTKDTAATSMA